MAANVQQINVRSAAELENTISSYIAQGFVVSNRSEDTVTLFKKKEFNIIWAVIGFFLCLLPLIIYSIVYAMESDQMIVIRVGTVGSPAQLRAPAITWSEDGEWWWDGTKWRDATTEMPPGVQLSKDQQSWWDGSRWHPVPAAPEGQATPSPSEAPPPATP